MATEIRLTDGTPIIVGLSPVDVVDKIRGDVRDEARRGDTQRLTDAVEPNLDPAPADVQAEVDGVRSDIVDTQSNVDAVASDLSELCSALTLTDALSDEFLACP